MSACVWFAGVLVAVNPSGLIGQTKLKGHVHEDIPTITRGHPFGNTVLVQLLSVSARYR
jgi:hypothetical protein